VRRTQPRPRRVVAEVPRISQSLPLRIASRRPGKAHRRSRRPRVWPARIRYRWQRLGLP
jgi:hypothetical protein